MVAASAGMAVLLWALTLVLESSLETAGVRIAALAALIAAGLAAYGGLALVTGVLSVSEMHALVARRRGNEQGKEQGQG